MHDTLVSVDAPETIFAVPETTSMRERIVVAPCSGRFCSLPADDFTIEGEWVEPGAILGEVQSNGRKVPVHSPFRGWVKGMLALEGQPVKEGEALFWVWGC
jgi:biotin carboxyl carrier protein